MEVGKERERERERDRDRDRETEIIYLSLHCHHQNDFCIKVGSDESHFNVSLIVRSKVTRQCPQTTTCEEKGEPKRIRTEAPPPLTSLMPYRLAKPAHCSQHNVVSVSSLTTTDRAGEIAITIVSVTRQPDRQPIFS